MLPPDHSVRGVPSGCQQVELCHLAMLAGLVMHERQCWVIVYSGKIHAIHRHIMKVCDGTVHQHLFYRAHVFTITHSFHYRK